uniref:DRBM domain-containing protein n=1 Tax=Glossina brevipalpis TaxID=37001 RepID=A0A1A9X5L8_9MUSC
MVSVLQEYCAKNRLSAPVYVWTDTETGPFKCIVSVMDVEGHGHGRSKRDAKHLAATDAFKKLQTTHAIIDEIPQNEQMQIPIIDMIAVLRDYCIQHRYPIPTFEIVQDGGTPSAPEFLAICSIASIQKSGKSDNKKDARQKAASAMLSAMQSHSVPKPNSDIEIIALDERMQEFESELYQKFKTYRQLTDSVPGEISGVPICERHNYFRKFNDQLRAEANNILAKACLSDKQKVNKIFAALKITPKIYKIPALYGLGSLAQPITNGVQSTLSEKKDRYTAAAGANNDDLKETLLNNADNFLKSNAIVDQNFNLKAKNHRYQNVTNFTNNYTINKYSSGFVPIKFPDVDKSSSHQNNHSQIQNDDTNNWSSGDMKLGMLPHKQAKRNQISSQYYNSNSDHLSITGNSANTNVPNYRSYDAGAYSRYYVPSMNEASYSIGNEMEESVPFDVYGSDGQYPGSGGEYSYTFPIAQKTAPPRTRSELSHKALLAKSFLIPLASAAVLGIAAALVSNPLLLQLGTVSSAGPVVVGKRKRRDLLTLNSNSK